MNTIHRTSPCCQARSIKYGNRRRQCVRCRRTWRPRQRKHGRHRKRVHADRAQRYFRGDTLSTKTTAARLGCSRETIRADRRRSRDRLLRHAWHPLPERGRLIVIADALVERFNGKKYTVYLIIVRPVDSIDAVIAPPVMRQESECRAGWDAAFAALPPATRLHICALVCDGNQALRGLAQQREWHLQRCQFHLKLTIANYCGRGALSRQKIRAWLVHTSVDVLLRTTDPAQYARALTHLCLYITPTKRRGLHKVLRGLQKNILEYRTYLREQALHLPTTSNAAESLVRCVRALTHRARGFSTPESYEQWIRALLFTKRNMHIRGYDQ